MFRHHVRHIVVPGQFDQFKEAFKQLNAAAPGVGLPTYQLWQTLFGDFNEVFAEAEYDSLDAHVGAWQKASSDETLMAAFRKMVSHTVPGTVRDYPLAPIDL